VKGVYGIVNPRGTAEELSDTALNLARRDRSLNQGNGVAIRTVPGAAFAGDVVQASGSLIAIGGRIDNATEIQRRILGGSANGSSSLHIALLHGLRALGGSFLRSIYGDFCIAAYDAERDHLLLARDVLGVVPLFYTLQRTALVFAPTMDGLLGSGYVNPEPAPEKMFLYLQGTELPADMSCYKNVSRLPAAHILLARPGKSAHISRYHNFAPDRGLIAEHPEENAERFLQLLYDAVRCRMPSDGKVAVELSGGLDSSTIFAIARDLGGERVVPISGIFPKHSECDESGFIDAVAERWGSRADKFSVDALSLAKAAISSIEAFQGLHNAANIHLSTEVYRRAANSGCIGVMNGVDGDNVVSHGRNLLSELLLAGRRQEFLMQLNSAAETYSRYSSNPEAYLAATYGLPALQHLRRNWQLWRLLAGAVTVAGIPGVSRRSLISELLFEALSVRSRSDGAQDGLHGAWRGRFPKGAFRAEFVRGIAVEDLLRYVPSASGRCDVMEADAHCAAFENGVNQHYFEYTWPLARTYKVTTISPFMDRGLLEFCISLPAEEKMGHGFTRLIQRRAMRNLLPSQILARRWKADLSASSLDKVVREIVPLIETRVGNKEEPLHECVHKDYVISLCKEAQERKRLNKAAAGRLWVLFCLNEWLRSI